MIWVLLGLRARLWWNWLTRGPRPVRHFVTRALGAVLATAFVIVMLVNSAVLIERIAVGDPLVTRNALTLLLAGGVILSIVTSVTTAFHHLFLAGDLDLLLSAPVARRDLFALKILETWRDGLHVAVFLLATLIGFGIALDLGPQYFVLAVLVALVLTLAGAALGTVFTLALTPLRWGNSVLGAARLLALALFVPIGVLGVPAIGMSRRFPLGGQGGLDAAAGSLRALGPPPAWLPTTWATQVLLGGEAAVLSGVLLVACAAVVFGGAFVVFERAFDTAWERVRYTGPAATRSGWQRWQMPALPSGGPILGVLAKDLRTMVRDPRWRTSTLVSLGALIAPALIVAANAQPDTAAPNAMQFWLGLFPIPYLAYILGNQHGAATLTYEGRNIALLRAAPAGFGRLLSAKLLGGLVVVLLVTWAATLFLTLRSGGGPGEIALALLGATWLAIGGTAAGVTGAALTVEFDGDNPQRRMGCFGTAFTTGLSVLFFGANTVLLAWIVIRTVGTLPRFLLGVRPVLDWLVLPLALLSVAALIVSARFGMRRLANWESS